MKEIIIRLIHQLSMAKGDSLFLPEDHMWAISAGIEWMDGVNSSILLVDLLTKDIGKLENLMDTANCLMRHPYMYKRLTTVTSIKFNKKMMGFGRCMRVG